MWRDSRTSYDDFEFIDLHTSSGFPPYGQEKMITPGPVGASVAEEMITSGPVGASVGTDGVVWIWYTNPIMKVERYLILNAILMVSKYFLEFLFYDN